MSIPQLLSPTARDPFSVLFILSITISAPLLAINITLVPIPITTNLFGDLSNLPRPSQRRDAHNRSGSLTVVDGRRSVDIWLSTGNAIDGKNKLSRATSLLSRTPKLSLLPVKPVDHDYERGELNNSSYDTRELSIAETSTFVAIEYSREELDRELSLRRGVCRPDMPPGGSFNSYPSVLSYSGSILAPHSRQSSVSSRSSRGSRPFRGPFMTNLETIADVSLNTPQRHARSASMNEGVYNSLPLEQTHQDLITCTPVHQTNAGAKEIDYLSAKVLPLLVPGLSIGEGIKVQKTPEAVRKGLTSALSFSTPELISRASVSQVHEERICNNSETEHSRPSSSFGIHGGQPTSGIIETHSLIPSNPECSIHPENLDFLAFESISSPQRRQSRIPRRHFTEPAENVYHVDNYRPSETPHVLSAPQGAVLRPPRSSRIPISVRLHGNGITPAAIYHDSSKGTILPDPRRQGKF